MTHEKLVEFNRQIDDISKFFKLNRKTLKKQLKDSLSDLYLQLNKLSATKEQLEFDSEILHNKNNELIKRYKVLHDHVRNITKKNNQLKEDFLIKQEELLAIKESYKSLEQTMNDVSQKYELISQVLCATSIDNKGFESFRVILRNDFLDFANKESSLAEEARATLMMQSIEKKLELIVSFPTIYNKNIIAIGGGFSAGKSSFVNSFFINKNFELPVDLNPVTAIPTYIIPGKKDRIRGHSQKGGVIDIKPDMLSLLSHNYINSFKFRLKDIMPFISVETPIDGFDNICFIDTPGYNPSELEGEFTIEDKNTASEYLSQAGSLLWLIGIDNNGTIPRSDLNFLTQLDLHNKRLYFVVNKSDLRSEGDLIDILDEIEQALDDFDVSYEGISAFSTISKKEYAYRKLSLFEFLENENIALQSENAIIDETEKVFQMYFDAITMDIDRRKKYLSQLNSIELDMLELGFDSTGSEINNRIEELRNISSAIDHEKNLEKMFDVKDSILSSIRYIFDDFKNNIQTNGLKKTVNQYRTSKKKQTLYDCFKYSSTD